MGLYGKCSYCKTAGHTLYNCLDESIPDLIKGLEQSITNRYTYNKILLFLQCQPAIHVRILARKHRLSTSVQKGFLIERLTPIYYNIHKHIRLCELGGFIHDQLQPCEPLYTNERFCIDRLAYYLYTHLIHEVQCLDDDSHTNVITKLAYVSNTLNTLYREVYQMNAEKNNRYYEWTQYIYDTITNMHHTMRVQLTHHLQDTGDESPGRTSRPTITPYMLVSSSRTFRNKTESCPICYDDILPHEKLQFKCGHVLCNTCTHTHVETSAPNLPQCVLCRAEIREIYTIDKTVYAEWDNAISH